jgi:hypothetical protein
MYSNKLATAIKVNGKVLREFKDTVYIPYGSEYTILVKNINTQRAVVNVFIDGDDILPGGLVLNAGQEVDLERSIRNGNLTEGNRFKFIERTENIENGPRGIKLEDGLIRVEYQFEIPRPVISVSDSFWKQYPPGVRGGWLNDISGSTGVSGSGFTNDSYSSTTSTNYNVNGIMRSVDFSAGEKTRITASSATSATLQSMNISASVGEVHDGSATMDCNFNDVGITVPGSKSTQKFQTATIGTLEAEKHTMVIKLLGDLGNNKPVVKPVTVKSKPKCVTCGKLNKANSKFCTECGTSLELVA